MPDIRITLIGDGDVQRNSERIVERLESGELLEHLGQLIEIRAKLNASGRPGPKVQTDRLRSSITHKVSPDKKEGVVGTNVEYAPPVEFGHRVRGHLASFGLPSVAVIGKTRRRSAFARSGISAVGTRMTPAYPFMQPALEQVRASGEMEGVFGQFAIDIERDWMS